MSQRTSESMKVRNADHAAAVKLTNELPVSMIDVITIWRKAYEKASPAAKQKALQEAAREKGPVRGREAIPA